SYALAKLSIPAALRPNSAVPFCQLIRCDTTRACTSTADSTTWVITGRQVSAPATTGNRFCRWASEVAQPQHRDSSEPYRSAIVGRTFAAPPSRRTTLQWRERPPHARARPHPQRGFQSPRPPRVPHSASVPLPLRLG